MANTRGWIAAGGWAGVNIDEFPRLKKWEERMWARPALKKGADVPDKYRMKDLLKDKEGMEKLAAKVWIHSTRVPSFTGVKTLIISSRLRQSQQWVQQGMAEDRAKNEARSTQL